MPLTFPPPATENETPDVVELLLDCHQRIRFFTELARRLGEADDLPADEVRGAAARVRRYFTEALPLHVADEEESLTPRLRGREPELDAALERMATEHRRHEPLLATLVATCEALEAAPARHAGLRGTLLETAAALAEEFEVHLGQEERVVIPALRRLFAADLRAALADEVRARRKRAWQG
ncbi:MAG TPA: hemerythrin domain-containing protein [bacterium]|nr:hemerythrin domain-containing protein [bacterium]